MHLCSCKDCKKERRKGLVLGSRKMGYWLKIDQTSEPEYCYGNVSTYVSYPKFQKGRRRKDPTVRPRKHSKNSKEDNNA
jgi:hypothetical protein